MTGVFHVGTQTDIYANLHFVAALVSLTAAYFAWGRRNAPGAAWLLMVSLAASLWAFADGMDLSSNTVETHVFWAKLSYLGAGTVSVFMLLFALEYTRQGRRIGPRGVAALLVVPALTFVATLFNEQHQLTWTGFTQSPTDPHVLVYHHGPLFWLLILYSFALLFVATVIIIGFARKTSGVYKNQSISVIVAILVPWAAMVAYIGAPGRFPGFNPSIALVTSGAILTFSILRHRLLDLVPIAREALVEKMSDGVLALDSASRVVDFNPATLRLLGLGVHEPAGQPLEQLLTHWPEAASRIAQTGAGDDHFTLAAEAGTYIGFEVSPLKDGSGAHQGHLVTLRDVTDRMEAERALMRANEELQARVADIESLHAELSEQAIRDPLTGLLNRRYLSEMLTREIGRAAREGSPVSFVMLDIDGFKLINDLRGHATGDLILRVLGSQLLAQTRPGDIVCRYGGDEFLLVLTNTNLEVATERAEHWRATFEASSTELMGLSETVSISVGVATYPLHGESIEQVFAAADAAMYAAKAAGRNRVTVSPL
jgi:diguanylate cyclase (GGDEF)-like protein/PAS domain S-box-containing protein